MHISNTVLLLLAESFNTVLLLLAVSFNTVLLLLAVSFKLFPTCPSSVFPYFLSLGLSIRSHETCDHMEKLLHMLSSFRGNLLAGTSTERENDIDRESSSVALFARPSVYSADPSLSFMELRVITCVRAVLYRLNCRPIEKSTFKL